jgi:ABC-type lipoprotein export system ATPase subunit
LIFGTGSVLFNEGFADLSERVHLVDQSVEAMLVGSLTGRENIQCAAIGRLPSLRGPLGRDTQSKYIQEFSLPMNTPADLLSGGQRQILAILMALQKKKNVLLLDEPTASLDEKNSALVMSFLQRLASESSTVILVVCHDRGLLEKHSEGTLFELYKKENGERGLVKITPRGPADPSVLER